MKKGIIIIGVVAVVVIGYFLLVQNDANKTTNNSKSEESFPDTTQKVPTEQGVRTEETQVVENPEINGEVEKEVIEEPVEEDVIPERVVIFDGASYSPQVLNVKVGEMVTWLNKSNRNTRPASAVHPTHNVYPTTGGCLGSTLDACKALGQGESYSFTFEEVGAWKMHDHRSPSITMTVVVTQ